MRDSQLRVYHAADIEHVRPAVLAVRPRNGGGAAFGPELRRMASVVGPDLLLRDVLPLDAALRKEQWVVRLEAALTLGVTVSVLALCSVGIYSLMSFTVSQRRREIGIRMALGATRVSIAKAIFSRALKQLGAGALLGALLAVVIVSAFGQEATDASTSIASVIGIVLIVGVLAAIVPTRRSLQVQPTEALREP